MLAARRTRRSAQGDFGFHCSGYSTHHAAGERVFARRSLGSALIVAASTPTIRYPRSASPVFSIASRVVRSGTPLMTTRLIEGFLRQYCSLASRIVSMPGVLVTTRYGPSPTG